MTIDSWYLIFKHLLYIIVKIFLHMQLTSEHEAVEPLSLLALSWQLLNFYFDIEIKVPKEINY